MEVGWKNYFGEVSLSLPIITSKEGGIICYFDKIKETQDGIGGNSFSRYLMTIMNK